VATGRATPSVRRPTPTHPISDEVVTTVERTIVALPIPADAEKILPYEVEKYAANGYGRWEYGPGVPVLRRTDLLGDAATAEPAADPHRLLRFFTITDVHITDQQSPAQAILIGYKGGSPLAICAYSMVMPYTVHVLDAVVQTINALHERDPFDFGIGLGDACNSTQFNELRWYIDVLDGKVISPRSGTDDDTDLVDYLRDFQAAGLDPSIDWYQAIGNHDQFWMGVMPADDHLREVLAGDEILDVGDIFGDPEGMDSRGLYMGSLDCSTEIPRIIGIGPESEFPEPPRIPGADPRRRSLRKSEWIGEFLDSTSTPAGHGFDRAAADAEDACYSFRPDADVPIKVIALDDTQRVDDENVVGLGGYGHGSLTRRRFDWLVAELEAGQVEDQLMIVACHIPIRIQEPGFVWWSSVSEVSEDELVEALQRFPNLILWAAGHRHMNTVTVVESPDPARPELGFYEVETFSLRDFPQEFRTFDVQANGDGTVSVVATCVDPAVAEGSPAASSRDYAVASFQLFTEPDDVHAGGPVNVELVVPLSARMAEVVDALAAPAA
jgi:metallophosphoesterase (TIGR03768 family)